MERLWSPWRLTYITGHDRPANDTSCIFCAALKAGPQNELVVFCGKTCFVILNLYPYNNGHLMVVTNRHVASLAETTPEERLELADLMRLSELALTEALHPEGMNLGLNFGKPAGAGVVGHLHVHVVPRWNGDTNFMTVAGSVRVLPESLDQTAARLRPIFERLGAERA